MKTSVSVYDFRDAFMNARPDDFSYEGLTALFDHLEQYEQECDTEIELDVIAICCEFTEGTIEDHLNDYGLETLEELEGRTIVIYVDDMDYPSEYGKEIDGDKRIIIQNF
jgi:tRNA A37 threonylcarbamoyltransferase TsaD